VAQRQIAGTPWSGWPSAPRTASASPPEGRCGRSGARLAPTGGRRTVREPAWRPSSRPRTRKGLRDPLFPAGERPHTPLFAGSLPERRSLTLSSSPGTAFTLTHTGSAPSSSPWPSGTMGPRSSSTDPMTDTFLRVSGVGGFGEKEGSSGTSTGRRSPNQKDKAPRPETRGLLGCDQNR
jgi:hypothetical protein